MINYWKYRYLAGNANTACKSRPSFPPVLRGSRVSNLERVLEAVGGILLVSVSGFIPLLAEQEHLVIQEQMPLHGLESGQVLHLKPA